jgi:hypothetical protein
MFERRMWPTPCANDDNKSPPAHMAMKTRMKGGPRYTITSLQVAAKADAMGFSADVPIVSNQLMLFAEAFPVSPTPWLADAAALPTSATSGPSSPDSFANLNPDGSWRKTCQGYSQLMLDGSLEPFLETWPRAGMTQSGTAYRLLPSAPLTDVTASGLWPTPAKADGERGSLMYQGNHNPTLLGAAKMWPTPTSRDHKDGSAQSCANVPTNGLLGRVVHESSRQPPECTASGSLNPVFCEWLMGYPLGWTALEDSAIASFRRSRNGSRRGSSPPRP